MHRSAIFITALLPLTVGCADLYRGNPETTEQILETSRELVPSSEPRARARIEGTSLEVAARRRCNLVEMESKERTTVYEMEMEDSDVVLYGMLAGFGSPLLGLGVAMAADAPNVYDTDSNSRQYNYLGPEYPAVFGAIVGAIGATMVGFATVNGIRALDTEEETVESTEQGDVLRRNVPCQRDEPAAGMSVDVRWTGGALSVGHTDAQGRLSVDLADKLSPNVFASPTPPATLEIWIGQQQLGTIDGASIGPAVVRRHDDLAWKHAQPEACAQSPTPTTCAGVRQYLASHPEGLHAVEAKSLLSPLESGPLQIAGAEPPDPLQQSIAEAQRAAEEAAERVRKKAEERAQVAAQRACVAACRKACGRDRNCRSSCTTEACQ